MWVYIYICIGTYVNIYIYIYIYIHICVQHNVNIRAQMVTLIESSVNPPTLRPVNYLYLCYLSLLRC